MPDTAPSQKLRHVYLVDGSGYIFRAFHALPPMSRADGTPTNAVYGFTNMLLKLLGETDADAIAVIFDSARTSFRNEIYADYKAHRPEPPDELRPQFALVRDATRALNLPCIEQNGFEADDLIATYARMAAAEGAEVTIVSSDKDLMQLVGGPVFMLDPVKNKRIGVEEVKERFGVLPEKVVDVQALTGDATDNVPGVRGIGVKTAAELIAAYGDLDTLLARAGEIKQPKRRETLLANADLARVSRELVRLKGDVPVKDDLESFRVKPQDQEKLVAFLREQEFKTLLARVLEKGLAAVGSVASTATPARSAPAAPPKPAEARYELVQTADALRSWIARAYQGGIVAFGIKATSPDAMRARLCGVAMAVAPGDACYVPLGHGAAEGLQLDEAAKQIKLEEALALLRPLLADPAMLKVGHDIKRDSLLLSRAPYSVAVSPVDDTMLLSYVLACGLNGHGVEELAQLHLGHQTVKYEEVVGSGKTQVTFDRVPFDKALAHAAEDADMVIRLHRALKPRLVEGRVVTVYETMERALIPVLAAMERAGVKVDEAELKRLSEDFGGRIATLEKTIHKLAGHPFNIGSPKQLGEVLFDEMGIEGGKKTKTGAYGTGADILEELAAAGHELPERVLDWRQLTKLKSTYTDALALQINAETGRIHTTYDQAIAATGRLSSNDPNLQNIPIRTEEGRRIRGAFVAEKGMTLVSLDYSQIELRLLAHVAGIDVLKEAFRKGQDIHALTASQVFGEPIEGMSPETRRRAKAINFGIIYGISPFGLARQLGIPQGDAKRYIEAYFERYPGIRAYMDARRAEARKKGCVVTIFGRRIHLSGINDKIPARRAFAERQAINAPLQGAAADIIKRAMVRVPAAMAAAKLTGRMLLQVHDELLFEVPDAEVETTIATVKRVMEGAAHLSVPLVVEAGKGRSWAEAH